MIAESSAPPEDTWQKRDLGNEVVRHPLARWLHLVNGVPVTRIILFIVVHLALPFGYQFFAGAVAGISKIFAANGFWGETTRNIRGSPMMLGLSTLSGCSASATESLVIPLQDKTTTLKGLIEVIKHILKTEGALGLLHRTLLSHFCFKTRHNLIGINTGCSVIGCVPRHGRTDTVLAGECTSRMGHRNNEYGWEVGGRVEYPIWTRVLHHWHTEKTNRVVIAIHNPVKKSSARLERKTPEYATIRRNTKDPWKVIAPELERLRRCGDH
ncbi:hypothetical protein BS47DRAFT_1384335 [Hydnum rufescens UP504]|uniref:Uncharacterized protein n=1 Tax=Hydnum rufescens UP504 TaxID=1448309 RepID=A0A9P6AQ68_9AGAM|nr:hypothetical protein BS47DRAFT_1384335 [Hydnum rufescens UP504]